MVKTKHAKSMLNYKSKVWTVQNNNKMDRMMPPTFPQLSRPPNNGESPKHTIRNGSRGEAQMGGAKSKCNFQRKGATHFLILLWPHGI